MGVVCFAELVLPGAWVLSRAAVGAGSKSVWSCCREANSQSLVKCIKEIQVCTRGLKGVRERGGEGDFHVPYFSIQYVL